MKPSAKLLDQARRLAHDHLYAIVSVYETDKQTCVWASPSHQPIMGHDPKDMIGHSWMDFVAPEDHSHANLVGADALLTGQSIEVGMRARTTTGHRLNLRGRAWIVPDPDTETPFLFFKADVVSEA